METEGIIQRPFHGKLISYNTKTHFWSARDYKAYFKERGVRMDSFMKLQHVKAIVRDRAGEGVQCIKTYRGRLSGGTWLNNEIMELFHLWLDLRRAPLAVRRFEEAFGQQLRIIFDKVAIFEEQYIVGGYRADFYSKQLALVIEYDEPHHKQQEGEDKKRQNQIANKLKAKIIRVEQGRELEGLNLIVRYIYESQAQKEPDNI